MLYIQRWDSLSWSHNVIMGLEEVTRGVHHGRMREFHNPTMLPRDANFRSEDLNPPRG